MKIILPWCQDTEEEIKEREKPGCIQVSESIGVGDPFLNFLIELSLI